MDASGAPAAERRKLPVTFLAKATEDEVEAERQKWSRQRLQAWKDLKKKGGSKKVDKTVVSLRKLQAKLRKSQEKISAKIKKAMASRNDLVDVEAFANKARGTSRRSYRAGKLRSRSARRTRSRIIGPARTGSRPRHTSSRTRRARKNASKRAKNKER